MTANGGIEKAQPVTGLEDDSDDDFNYETVDVEASDVEEGDDNASEDLDAAMRSLQALSALGKGREAGKGRAPTATERPPPAGTVTKKPEVMDDFLRNFFVKMGLARTCETFEAEWYELKATGRLEGNTQVPDVYQRNMALEEEVAALRSELSEAHGVAARASATWDSFRKERDFHRMHHKRVAQEKNKLITDIKRLKEHFAKYEPTILELKRKYETAMKEKMLASLERDKLAARMDSDAQFTRGPQSTLGAATGAQSTLQSSTAGGAGGPSMPTTSGRGAAAGAPDSTAKWGTTGTAGMTGTKATRSRSGWASITAPKPPHPYADMEFTPANPKAMSLQKTFKGHLLSVANMALHPTKPILVTASDDKTWKMWHMPAGDLIMCGEGHKDWVAGVDFNPNGASLASGSGDAAVKVWDFAQQRCVLTFTDHKQAVWGVRYHHSGDVLASCSLDHTVRLWDVPAAKCRMALRGHVDSVNDVNWQPYSSALATASSDKTLSIWDARSGLCSQTFYGHMNSCNAAVFNLMGNMLASTDADGMLKLWDTRMVAELRSFSTGKHPANKCAFDSSGEVLAVALDSGRIKVYNTVTGEGIVELAGHEDAAQSVLWDPANSYLVSCGSDNTFRLWS